MFTTDTKAGAAQFAENIQLFADARTKPEQYNLYAGLKNLALAVHEQREQIKSLEKQLQEVLKLLKSR